jgi:hypothetical protein
MNRPRLIRGIKITWTVICGIACLLLIVLWVRSYWWGDSLTVNQSNTSYFGLVSMSTDTIFVSSRGRVGGIWNGASGLLTPSWKFTGGPITVEDDEPGILGFSFTNAPLGLGRNFSVPYWFLVVISAAIGGVSWLPWWPNRFSLRTLLIATTLVAVVLGLIVWATRQ